MEHGLNEQWVTYNGMPAKVVAEWLQDGPFYTVHPFKGFSFVIYEGRAGAGMAWMEWTDSGGRQTDRAAVIGVQIIPPSAL